MGIKNLNKFLRDKCPEVFQETHISNFSFQKVAIDISLYMYKFKAIAGERWLSAFLNLITSLRRNHIHCVFIFDGKSPPEKEEERMRRRAERDKLEQKVNNLLEAIDEYHKTGEIHEILTQLWERRRKKPAKRLLGSNSTSIDMDWVIDKVEQKKCQIIHVTTEDFDSSKQLFDILNIPHFTAPWEAEKMCAKLCIDGIVDAVLSEDTDVIAYGAPTFITKLDTRADTAVVIDNSRVQTALEFSHAQLLDLCIMCGTDYNSNIFRVGAHTAYKKLVAFENIEGVGEKTKLDISILKHKIVRGLFTKFEDYGITSIPYCGSPNYKKLLQFIVRKKIWYDTRRNDEENLSSAENRLQKIKDDFTRTDVVFE